MPGTLRKIDVKPLWIQKEAVLWDWTFGHPQASAKADDAEDAEHWLSEMIKEKILANEAASELGKDLLNIEKHC